MGKKLQIIFIKICLFCLLAFGIYDTGASQAVAGLFPLSTSAFLAQPVRDSVITIQRGDKEGWRGLALSASKTSFVELPDGIGGQVASGYNNPEATPAIIRWMEDS